MYIHGIKRTKKMFRVIQLEVSTGGIRSIMEKYNGFDI